MPKHEHTLRQSMLSGMQTCAERTRWQYVVGLPHEHTDATALGTAVHAAIEMHYLEGLDLSEMQDCALAWLDSHEWREVKHRPETIEKYALIASELWWHEIRTKLDGPVLPEEGFNLQFHEDDERIIRLSGTMDAVDCADASIWDWKVVSQPYKPWEKQRWSVQASTYSWAARELYRLEGEDDFELRPFVYAIIIPSQHSTQLVPVRRDEGHINWLRKQCVNLAKLIEAGLDEWPMNDGSALCSSKWCPAWEMCKGGAVSADWDKR